MAATTNRPSNKQINYILKLIGGSYESHAYAEISKDMGVSATAAGRRATMQDASRTIDRLVKANR